eukprot:gene7473-biopygen19564
MPPASPAAAAVVSGAGNGGRCAGPDGPCARVLRTTTGKVGAPDVQLLSVPPFPCCSDTPTLRHTWTPHMNHMRQRLAAARRCRRAAQPVRAPVRTGARQWPRRRQRAQGASHASRTSNSKHVAKAAPDVARRP